MKFAKGQMRKRFWVAEEEKQGSDHLMLDLITEVPYSVPIQCCVIKLSTGHFRIGIRRIILVHFT